MVNRTCIFTVKCLKCGEQMDIDAEELRNTASCPLCSAGLQSGTGIDWFQILGSHIRG
jgi:hypothetical protein